jgi:uncharacterized protein (TIGR02594 family)
MRLVSRASKLNLRQNPSIDAEAIGVIDKNEIVTMLQFSDNMGWAHVRKENGVEGWSMYKYFLVMPNQTDIRQNDFTAMKVAFGELISNIRELEDPAENQRIVQYLNSCDNSIASMNANSDETNWCSAFVNWCVESTGISGTNSAWALDWLNWGMQANPTRGTIAVFKRFVRNEKGEIETYGHVGFYLGVDPDDSSKIVILGGNQGNQVSIKSYPTNNESYRLMGYRKALNQNNNQ